LIVARKSRLGSSVSNSSCFSNARIAEESAIGTPSFTLCLFPTLGDQLGYKITVFRNVARYNRLSHPDRLFRGAQPYFTLADRLDQQFVARL
jgi:hypothetical protein